jgi:hypothetical protein
LSDTKQKKKWVMPEWMEKYRNYLNVGSDSLGSTTSIDALMNDTETNPFNNSIRWSMILVVQTRVKLLEDLKRTGWLLK